MVCILEEGPFGLQQALSSLDANFWKEAINDGDSLESNETWVLVDLHHGCKQSVVFGFWIKKLKHDSSLLNTRVAL
jgi:hypothetical protein